MLPTAAPAPTAPAAPDAVQALRRFNRFFTQRIGVLAPYLGSELSLTDVRVLYELAHRRAPVARALQQALGLDAGYLSRILKRFEAAGWLARSADPQDARQHRLTLTEAGQARFAPLQQASRDQAAALLAPLAAAQQQQLVGAMAQIETLLDARAAPGPVLLREPAPGDMGWVVQQHGEVYAREYGFNSDFEALVAGIAADFIRKFQPGLERGWIAARDGERLGAIFLVRKSATVAQLRLLIVSPQARGLGLGARLTNECLAFARAAGYRKVVLWTNSCLLAARDIYARRGFRLMKSEAFEGYGQPLVGETWELRLGAAPPAAR